MKAFRFWAFWTIVVTFVITMEYIFSITEQVFQHRIHVYTTKEKVLMQKDFNANASKPKTILLWNKYFHFPHFGFGTGQKAFSDLGCPVNNCFITDRVTDKLEMPVEDYDAVCFHMWSTRPGDFPIQRKPHQRYVFFLLESPQTMSVNLFPVYKNYFNWTMTYRRDSDIWRPYGWLSESVFSVDRYPFPVNLHSIGPYFNNNTVLDISQKKNLVAWFISHCNTTSGRDVYVKELSKYVPVHIYGKCGKGNYSCSRKDPNKCYKLLDKQYKFYLSFENSLCKDYVTEKLFYVIQYNVVPVVYGGVNYTEIMPPMSYIDVSNFSSPKELADYLLYLDKYPQEYKKYFWWKDFYKVYTWHSYTICKLCEMLHNFSLPNKVYSDIRKWWGGPGICHLPKDHFKKKVRS